MGFLFFATGVFSMVISKLLCLLLLIQPVSGRPPLIVSHDDETAFVAEQAMLASPIPGTPLLDLDKANDFINDIDLHVRKKPKNASINDAGLIVKEEIGYRLNRKVCLDKIFQYFYEGEPQQFSAPKIPLYPKVDSELLSAIREKRIGQYVTYFNTNNESRARNIELAAEAINNHVVFPGEIFSFNKTVGPRTTEKGYRKAAEIVRGELSEGIGGGICQVSSTLFNAVDQSGIKIIQRYSHSKKVPYVPPGRDATVSWYGPDFTFQNNFNQPILIKARALGGRVAVIIYSSEDINIEQEKIPENH